MRDRWPKIEAIKPPAASRSERIRDLLAAPVIWALAVLILVYFPYLLYDAIRCRFHSR